ncbi:MAG TPA: nuclear transport factor 2 family protein [Steroidobacteraceae bacterium]|nr:nuclear transport factor 2 family protein [Gammaproteobacteria bacterium]HEV2284887.1 nuclear transport factor 2 family protein [Steroidobacteraceae bacterium]
MLNPETFQDEGAEARPLQPAPAVLDDLAAARWIQSYDAAWLGRDWPRLERYLAADVALLTAAPGISIAGRRAVLEHMRSRLSGVEVHEYNTTDLRGRAAGDIGIICYRWQLEWTIGHRRQQLSGRDVLVLRAAPGGWQLLRRLPLDT